MCVMESQDALSAYPKTSQGIEPSPDISGFWIGSKLDFIHFKLILL